MSVALKTSQFQYIDDFKPSKSRKRRKNPIQPPNALELYTRCAEELKSGSWLEQCHHLLTEASSTAFSRVLCLGLGCPTSSREARAQLAFLLDVCDRRALNRAQVSLYDPAFTDEDVKLLEGFHLSVLPENKQGRYAIETPTLLFMPHCDKQLYERLLRENWTHERLPNLFMVCNDFRGYLDSYPSHKLATEFPCISRIAPYLSNRPLPTSSTYPNAFTSTAIQHLAPQTPTSSPSQTLPSDTDDAFWKLPPEDVDVDAENGNADDIGCGARTPTKEDDKGAREEDKYTAVEHTRSTGAQGCFV